MSHEATQCALYQSYRQQNDDTMDKKSELYLQIIFIFDYMMEENLFVDASWSPVKQTWFSVRKNDTHRAYITL